MKSPGKARVFGPVPSRRLGFSLGVDVIPYKTCALDCVYCQLGSSGRPTIARRGYASPRGVLSQVRRALARKWRIDYITFSGSGEPTLNAGLGRMIRAVKKITPVPVAVLTGSSLLDRPSVPGFLKWIYVYNPFSGILELYRAGFFPNEIWAWSNSPFFPSVDIPSDICLHHANCTEPKNGKSSMELKIEQLDLVHG